MRIKLRKTDVLFSLYIRTRDRWQCQRCKAVHKFGSQGLHCSHFFGRGKESTRFDPENCDALCFPCHRYWGHGDGRDEYKAFKVKQLGLKKFKALELRSNMFCKRDDKAVMLWLENLKPY